MCTVKTPKVQQPTNKQPVYLANPYLDGSSANGLAIGRNSLRIDRSAPGTTPPPASVGMPSAPVQLGIGTTPSRPASPGLNPALVIDNTNWPAGALGRGNYALR